MTLITSSRIQITWPIFFLIVLFVINIAIYSFGYRITADDVEFHHIAISKDVNEILKYGLSYAAAVGRIGHSFVIPLSIFSSYITEYMSGRIIASAIHFLSYIYFSYYLSSLTSRKIFIPLSISYLVLSPLLYSHTPPTSYPFILSVPFILILWSRMININDEKRFLSSSVFLISISISEYALLMGVTILIIENFINIEKIIRLGNHIFYSKLFIDFTMIFTSLLIYTLFRYFNPTPYVGIKMSGEIKILDSLYIGSSLIWNGTVFPHLNFSEFSIIGGIVAILVAVSIYFSLSTTNKMHWKKRDAFTLCALALCCVVTVIPFAFQPRMYEWCIIAGDCTYVISRISYLYLVPFLVLPIFIKNIKFFKILLLIISIPATLSNFDMAKSMYEYTQPFRNIAEKACESKNFYPGRVSMHPHLDQEAYWIDYRAYLRDKLGCSSVGSLDTWRPVESHESLLPGLVINGPLMTGLLIEGWHGLGAWGGAWSNNQKATINVPAVPGVEFVALRLRSVGNQVKPPIDQELAVTCSNGRPARFEAPDLYVCSLTKGGNSKIIVAVSELLSPSSLGINGDTRSLGVALHEVEFRGK